MVNCYGIKYTQGFQSPPLGRKKYTQVCFRKADIELEREAGEKEDMQEYIASKHAEVAKRNQGRNPYFWVRDFYFKMYRVEIMSKIVKVLTISNSQAVGEEIEHSNLVRLYGKLRRRPRRWGELRRVFGIFGSRGEEEDAFEWGCTPGWFRRATIDSFAEFITFLQSVFSQFGYTTLKRRTDRVTPVNYIIISTRPWFDRAAAIDWECLAANDKISKQNLPVLKAFLRSRKLKVGGRKAELVARVEAECRGHVVQSRTRAIKEELMSVVWQYGSSMMRYEMGDRFETYT